ncbi:hypothetical protein C5167_044869 [Papaver somniferum]|uniref:uncharacterized protein LOC113341629 isoform X2 n=1 Tax=Papaver somniferum TaxID=3469 RepID=UPI000E7005E9|nr:uncharacterized protein LOC113341629 isoform X2 [Papaver somniferum]XP_026444229.1 uncharacterized protein LOC113344480 isoform X2 [Papaver somniferum]RZC92645.1 hypothetical protein C5167_007567 [Papaver somniferum]RZC93448.1 hypothetical protein C5167_044869 [Papaver somniferum]
MGGGKAYKNKRKSLYPRRIYARPRRRVANPITPAMTAARRRREKDLSVAEKHVNHGYRLIYTSHTNRFKIIADDVRRQLEKRWRGLLVFRWILKPGSNIAFQVEERPSLSTAYRLYRSHQGDWELSQMTTSRHSRRIYNDDLSDEVGLHGGIVGT